MKYLFYLTLCVVTNKTFGQVNLSPINFEKINGVWINLNFPDKSIQFTTDSDSSTGTLLINSSRISISPKEEIYFAKVDQWEIIAFNRQSYKECRIYMRLANADWNYLTSDPFIVINAFHSNDLLLIKTIENSDVVNVLFETYFLLTPLNTTDYDKVVITKTDNITGSPAQDSLFITTQPKIDNTNKLEIGIEAKLYQNGQSIKKEATINFDNDFKSSSEILWFESNIINIYNNRLLNINYKN